MAEFQRSAGRWQKVEELRGFLDASLKDVSTRIFANERLTTEEKLERLEILKKSAIDIAQTGAEAKGRVTACNQMSRAMAAESQSGEVMGDFLDTFQAGVAAAQELGERPSARNCEPVTKVEKLIELLSGGGGDELEIQETVGAGSSRNLRCPVLNRPIEQPVKSTKCGHVYSLKGIISALYQAQRIMDERRFPKRLDEVPREYETRCPVVGCQHYISAGMIERDFATELSQRQMLSARDSMDGADEIEVV